MLQLSRTTVQPFQSPRPWLVLVLLAGLTALIYANSLKVPFVFDDAVNIYKNPHIMISAWSWSALGQIFDGPSASRPLAMLTLAVNYFFHQFDLTGYHLVNLLIHLLTAWLVYLIARQTLAWRHQPETILPLLAAALWLVNPLHIQSVTYIVQRMTALSTLFYLLALWCFIKGRRQWCQIATGHLTRARLWFAASALTGLMALMCKPIAATLPLCIFFYEWYFFQDLRLDWLKRDFKWVLFSIGLFILIAFMYLGTIPLEKILATYAKQPFIMPQRLWTQLSVVIFYLSLFFFPHPQRLNLDHDFPLATGLFEPAVTLVALLALLALLIAAVVSARKHRLASFALIWFGGNLVIESSLLGLALIYEHRTYLPSIFLCIGLSTWIWHHCPTKWLALGFFGLLVGLWGAWTHQRNDTWQTSLSLWRDCVDKSPQKAGPRNNLGLALTDRGQYRAAIDQHQKALALRIAHRGPQHPHTAASYNNLGGAFRLAGQYQKALDCHQKALAIRLARLGPNHPRTGESYYNLGIAYKNKKDFENASRYFKKALTLALQQPHPNPRHISLISANLGQTVRKTTPQAGSPARAQERTQIRQNQGLGYSPPAASITANNTLGVFFGHRGEYDLAVHFFKQALQDQKRVHREDDLDTALIFKNLATAYYRQRNFAAALSCLAQAQTIYTTRLGPASGPARQINRTQQLLQQSATRADRSPAAKSNRGKPVKPIGP